MRIKQVIQSDEEQLSEDQEIALAIDQAVNTNLSNFLNKQQEQIRIALVAGSVLVLAGVALLFTGQVFGVILLAGGLLIGGGRVFLIKNQTPEVTVESVERGYWTGYVIPDGDKAVVYDATDTVSEETFDLEMLADTDVVSSSVQKLDKLGDYPVVMPRDENIEAEFTATLESAQSEIENSKHRQINAPLIGKTEQEQQALARLLDYASAEPVETTTAISPTDAVDEFNKLNELEEMASSDTGESVLHQLTETSQLLADDLTEMQETVINQLNDHISSVANAFALVSYNFYCPNCLVDEIDTQLELTDLNEDNLRCSTCREKFTIDDAAPRLQIRDEIVEPTCAQLWTEKDDQRREIYENIEDQKSELQEREFEQRQETIRTAIDRIRNLRTEIRDIRTDARAAQGTVEEIGEMMVKYERLNEERKQEFAADAEAIFDEIDKQTQQLIEETRIDEQERMDKAQQKAEKKAELMREEERRREREKLAAQLQHQEEVARAQLESQVQLTQAQMEHEQSLTSAELQQEALHHRENYMIDTRGETSAWSSLDNFRLWKDRHLGSPNGGDN